MTLEAIRGEIADLTAELRLQREMLTIVCSQVTTLLTGATIQADAAAKLYGGLEHVSAGLGMLLQHQAAVTSLLVAASGESIH